MAQLSLRGRASDSAEFPFMSGSSGRYLFFSTPFETVGRAKATAIRSDELLRVITLSYKPAGSFRPRCSPFLSFFLSFYIYCNLEKCTLLIIDEN